MNIEMFKLTPQTAWAHYHALMMRKNAEPDLANDPAFRLLIIQAFSVLVEQFTPEGLSA